jgi:alpha-methylacyl-CoA racemase
MLLGDLGGDVIFIDRPGGPIVADRVVGTKGLRIIERGSHQVKIDLKTSEGLSACLRLCAQADIIIEGFRPGVAERLGIGPDHVQAINPRSIYTRVTGYGQDGPLASQAGHDINFIARTGLLHAIGRRGGPPQVPLNIVADYGAGGMMAAFGICAALVEREHSGLGQVIDAAMVDGVALLMASLLEKLSNGNWSNVRGTNALDTGAPNYDVYETSDGQWMAVGAREPVFFRRLLDALGLAELSIDETTAADAYRKAIAERFVRRSQSEWAEVFSRVDACVTPVSSLQAALADEALVARGTFRERDGYAEPGAAPRFSRTPAGVRANPEVIDNLDELWT